jgi:LPPG:FO 2-phospho-L-lactate transferase
VSQAPRVLLLTGGTGGAKLAAGIAAVVGEERLAALINTGDDIEIYGAHVSPDPDLVAFWLAGRIDARGWGIRDDTFAVMDALRELGVDVWFNLGDADLAWCIERTRLIAAGATATAALAELAARIGVRSELLAMCDEPVRTNVKLAGRGWLPFQEFMIRERAAGEIEDVAFAGAELARLPEAAARAIAACEAIVIGPSNPMASIGPILAVPGLRQALRDSPAPVVAVSPIVGGEVLKGPTASFLAWAGRPATGAGVAAHYGELLDGFVCDEAVPGVPTHVCDLLMDGAEGRARLARETLEFAATLRS